MSSIIVGVKAPYSKNMVNLFLFGCHVIDRAYVRTYSSTDCTGRVGETIKRKGGVSQACLGKSTSFTLKIHNIIIWSIDSCQNRMTSWPVNCLTRSWSMFNLIHSGLFRSPGKLIMHTYWTSILSSIDSCQNRVSADQYHLTVSRAQMSTRRSQVFFWSYPLTSC